MPERNPDLLDLEMRRRLYQLIEDYPGIHEREAARQLGTSHALVNFHRGVLERNGLVRVEVGDARGMHHLYTVASKPPTPEQRRKIQLLRSRLDLLITLILLANGSSRHGDVAQRAGVSKSKLSFHLRKLEDAGLVAKDADGAFAVIDPRETQRLLTKFRPTPDLIESMHEIWTGLYGPL